MAAREQARARDESRKCLATMASKKKTVRTRRRAPTKTGSRVFAGGIPRALGMRLVMLSRKRVVAEMPVTDMHRNLNGHVNGGALMAFADATAAAGAVSNMPPGHRGGTIESKTNFFASGLGPVLKAVSIPLHIGRTTSVWQTTISNSGNGSKIAIVTQTQIYLPQNTPAGSD
jgi:uncharacterized protein (TIGR00369 family)